MRKIGEYFFIREGEEESFNEGLIKKITYPMGNTLEYTYDIENDNRRSRANIKEVKQTPDSRGGEEQTTVYTYENDTNMVKSLTDPKGNTTQFTIAKLTGNMEQVTYPGGKMYRYTYNTYGQVETVTDPLSKITRYSYYPENVPSGSGEAAVARHY